MWVIVLAVVGFAMLLNLIGGNGGGSSSGPTSPPAVDRGSAEHKYVTERFKREGYSQAESEQAADAIIKFQRAQGK